MTHTLYPEALHLINRYCPEYGPFTADRLAKVIAPLLDQSLIVDLRSRLSFFRGLPHEVQAEHKKLSDSLVSRWGEGYPTGRAGLKLLLRLFLSGYTPDDLRCMEMSIIREFDELLEERGWKEKTSPASKAVELGITVQDATEDYYNDREIKKLIKELSGPILIESIPEKDFESVKKKISDKNPEVRNSLTQKTLKGIYGGLGYTFSNKSDSVTTTYNQNGELHGLSYRTLSGEILKRPAVLRHDNSLQEWWDNGVQVNPPKEILDSGGLRARILSGPNKAVFEYFGDKIPFSFSSEGLAVITTSEGAKFWFNRDGELHRGGGLPAVVHSDGSKEWVTNGKFQRLEVPTKIIPAAEAGVKENTAPVEESPTDVLERVKGLILKNHPTSGILHRGNPKFEIDLVNSLVVATVGTCKEWFNFKGERHRNKDLPAVEDGEGKVWFQNGIRARGRGLPAYVFAGDFWEWYDDQGWRIRRLDNPSQPDPKKVRRL